MAYQDDKYENFMTNLNVGREALIKFADFTVAATSAPGVAPEIVARAAGLSTARKAYREELVERQGAGGTSQTGTATEQQAFTAFKTFVKHYDETALNGYLFTHPDQRATNYPDDLRGLTQALKKDRLTRLTAYTEALEKADATLPPADQLPAVPKAPGAPAGPPERPGTAARTLLTAYEIAATARTAGRSTLKDAISDLTPAGQALTTALWGVHCAALNHYWQEPMQARKYFDYAHLPHRVTRPQSKPKAPNNG